MAEETGKNWASGRSLEKKSNSHEVGRRYWFLCEGLKTETMYFEGLIGQRRRLRISQDIDLKVCDKGGANINYPGNLLDYAKGMMADPEFDGDVDVIVIVFDYDIFERGAPGYDDIIRDIEDGNNIAAVSNPNFELFLLLHVKDAYKNFIKGKEGRYLTDRNGAKTGKFDYALSCLTTIGRLDPVAPKTDPRIKDFPKNVLNAIAEEKSINECVHDISGKVTCNVGKVIEEILSWKPSC